MNSPCLISVTAKMPIRISPSISLQHPSLLFPSNQNNSSKWPNATCNTKAESFVGKTQGHIYRRVKLLYKCSTLPNSSRKYTKNYCTNKQECTRRKVCMFVQKESPFLQFTVGVAAMVDVAWQVALEGGINHHFSADFTHVEVYLTLFFHHPQPLLTCLVINHCSAIYKQNFS